MEEEETPVSQEYNIPCESQAFLSSSESDSAVKSSQSSSSIPAVSSSVSLSSSLSSSICKTTSSLSESTNTETNAPSSSPPISQPPPLPESFDNPHEQYKLDETGPPHIPPSSSSTTSLSTEAVSSNYTEDNKFEDDSSRSDSSNFPTLQRQNSSSSVLDCANTSQLFSISSVASSLALEGTGSSSLSSFASVRNASIDPFHRRFSLDSESSSSGTCLSPSQDSPYLLPETSGCRSSSTLEKRGRGRPRKEGLNPLLRRAGSRGGLTRGLSRPISTRGGLGLGGRGSRGGRRGRPPFPHAHIPLISSTTIRNLKEGLASAAVASSSSSLSLSPAEESTLKLSSASSSLSASSFSLSTVKSNILPPSGMADIISQQQQQQQQQATTTSSTTTPSSTSSVDASNSGQVSTVANISSLDASQSVENAGPIHLCSLCNCGERSLLGQGEIWRFEPSPGFDIFTMQEPKSLRGDEEVDTIDQAKGGPTPTTWRRSRGPMKTGRERSRSPRQCQGDEDSSGCSVNDELAMIGILDDAEIAQLYEPTGHVWVHYCCALWSDGVTVGETQQLDDVDKAVYKAMSQRCSYCKRLGATMMCHVPDCGKSFHFPCASAGGCFQDMKTLSLLCPEHLDQVESIGDPIPCIQCGTIGDIKEQLFCTSCGHHYHGNCLCPPVDMKPIVRAGWQCPNCKICQTCRTAGEDSKMLVCDKCDKAYHTFCLKPAMTTIPKNGWKCKNCRICTDCGSRTPGSGPSSRWHLNYSVCDSCYQQRNKGLCCPLCGKAYRHFHNKAMLPCMLCKKFVHIECDPSISPNVLTKKEGLPQDYVCTVCKEVDPDMMMDVDQFPSFHQALSEESMESFMTDDTLGKDESSSMSLDLAAGSSGCGGSTSMLPSVSTGGSGALPGGLTASSSQESLYGCEDSSSSFDFDAEKSLMSPNRSRDVYDYSKKNRQKGRQFGSEKERHHHRHQQQYHIQQLPQQPFTSSQSQQQQSTVSVIEKPRGPKIKVKIGGQVVGIASMEGTSTLTQLSNQQSSFSSSSPAYSTPPADSGAGGQMEEAMMMLDTTITITAKKESNSSSKKDEDDDDDDGDDHPSTLILADSNDMFIMDQDICKACGSFGKDDEGKMIVCTQCGQCYHPYCVSVKVTKVMLQKGWRCLDCTVCEGCGKTYDEGRLLLCDDCDISYHTYCLDPPLETVPKGNWKCKWCVMCVNCGTTTPGYESQWQNNYTQCSPCHSKMFCPVCTDSYLLDQLIIQCHQCDRWLHCECDGLMGEDEAEIASDYGYHCLFCRART